MNKILYLYVLLLAFLPLQTIHAAADSTIKQPGKVSFAGKAPDALKLMIQSSLNRHPRMQAARAALQASIKRLKAAKQAVYNPELALDTERTDINTAYLQLSQTIDLADRRGSLTDVAQAELVKAKAEFELAVLQLQYDLVSSYLAHDTQTELYRLSNEALTLMSEFAKIAEQRYKAGDLSQTELDLARLAHSEAILVHTGVLTDAVTARNKLNAIFILLPSQIPAFQAKLPQANMPIDLESFLRTLPEIRAQVAQVNVARITVNLRRSERRVNPTIALRVGRDGRESMVGLTISSPINMRNNYSAEIEVAQQKLIESEQLGQQAFRNKRAKVLTTTQQLQLLRKAWFIWKKTGQSSVARQLKSIKRLWRAGDMSTSDYLVQLKQAIETQIASIKLRNKLWNSTLEWLLVTASIDDWLNLTTEIN